MSLNSYSSSSSSLGANAKDDDDKWVDDEPSLLKDNNTTVTNTKSDEKVEKENSVSSVHSNHSLSHSQIEDLSSSSSKHSQKSKKQSKAKSETADKDEKKQTEEKSESKQAENVDAPKEKQKATFGYHPSIQIALSGNKLAYNDGDWLDVSNLTELVESVHPIVAENINLQSRMKLLVRRIAETEYESQLIQNEISECDTVIEQLEKVLGTDEHSTEEEEDTF